MVQEITKSVPKVKPKMLTNVKKHAPGMGPRKVCRHYTKMEPLDPKIYDSTVKLLAKIIASNICQQLQQGPQKTHREVSRNRENNNLVAASEMVREGGGGSSILCFSPSRSTFQ